MRVISNNMHMRHLAFLFMHHVKRIYLRGYENTEDPHSRFSRRKMSVYEAMKYVDRLIDRLGFAGVRPLNDMAISAA